jgi:hypothetical protein
VVALEVVSCIIVLASGRVPPTGLDRRRHQSYRRFALSSAGEDFRIRRLLLGRESNGCMGHRDPDGAEIVESDCVGGIASGAILWAAAIHTLMRSFWVPSPERSF